MFKILIVEDDLKMEETTGQVATDKKWLGFVLDQILNNALKYTPPEGIITITTENKDHELVLVMPIVL